MQGTILIADKLPEVTVQRLENLGCRVLNKPELTDDALTEALRKEQPRIIIVRSTKVTGEMVEAAKNLSLVVRAGAGFNTIDVDAASAKSVYVANCPGKNAVAVAELAMGLILGIDRRIPDNVAELRNNTWNKKEYSKAEGIYGKTLAIIGVGKIGQEVITRARAFGLRVIAWSRSLTPEKAAFMGIGYCETPLDAAAEADIVSVHLALTPDTRGFIGADFFNAMKNGAFFVNTSRSEVVQETALLEALGKKNLKAGLDVFDGEPAAKQGEFSSPLASHPAVYGTHHIGASTEQAQLAVADETVRIVETYLSSGQVLNCVNVMEKTPAKYMVSVRHRDTVGVLADILRVIRDHGINIERMENIIFSGASGACANIQIDDALTEEQLAELTASSKDIYEAVMNEIE